MTLRNSCIAMVVIACAVSPGSACAAASIGEVLSEPIINPRLPIEEIRAYTEARVPAMPEVKSIAEWERYAERIRRDTLERVVFRGAPSTWRDTVTNVEWLGIIEGGPGYHIKKLRFEAVPGLWIPALLYEPDHLAGRVPVVMNTIGHEPKGKADPDTQIRCINEAKRGILALSVEWLGTGQLGGQDFRHSRMNQLDVCGTSGLAPFYLAMQRGLDVLLSLDHADPDRVAVTGFSGGGWQAIVIGALDPRVTLANPVAGYSSLRVGIRQVADIGDPEQTPTDLAMIADYTQLTALRAPRPTLLTFNAKDNCCYSAGPTLPPLMDAARPIFQLYGEDRSLRTHVNQVPGNHNFGQDNREALYRALADYFYPSVPDFVRTEIASDDEIKSVEALGVDLPADNANFNSLALELSKDLPHASDPPSDPAAVTAWMHERRNRLRELVRFQQYRVSATQVRRRPVDQAIATSWEFRFDRTWTVPAVEVAPVAPTATVILVGDAGRRKVVALAESLLRQGNRVLAVDPFYRGESVPAWHDLKFSLMLSAVGGRPLGVQVSQITAIARWAKALRQREPIAVVAVGQRSGLLALVAAALEPRAIDAVQLHDPLSSLKEVIAKNMTVGDAPELFCFGLLEEFDVPQLTAMIAPRPVATVVSTH